MAASPRTDPELAILIVNYNGWPDVARLVASLAAAPEVHCGRCEVIVVDNASLGPIPSILSDPRPGIRLIRRCDNGGFAVAVNAGWRASKARWILLLNPDVIAESDLPAAVIERISAYESRPDGGPAIVGFGLRNEDGSRQPSVGAFLSLWRCVREVFIPRSHRKYQADRPPIAGPAPWVTGACLLARSDLLRETGGMDEDFFLYYEEAALCREAHNLGRRVEFDPGVEVVHLHPLQGRAVDPRLRVITRHSKLLYFRKHRPRWEFFALSLFVSVEARIRSLIGDPASKTAWRTIGGIASTLRKRRLDPRSRRAGAGRGAIDDRNPGREIEDAGESAEDEGGVEAVRDQCPMPNAQCPMPKKSGINRR